MKRWAVFAMALLLLGCIVGCARQPEEQETAMPEQTGQEEQFSLYVSVTDENGAPYDADKIRFLYEDGRVKTASSNGAYIVLENMAAGTDIRCTLLKGETQKAEFTLSFWVGYETAFYNNLNTVSLDIPGSLEEVYVILQIDGEGNVACSSLTNTAEADTQTESDKSDRVGGDEQNLAAMGTFGTMAVSAADVNLRTQPSMDSTVVKKCNFADVVTLLNQGEEIDGVQWYRVKSGEEEGYISAEYLGTLYVVNKNGVNVREDATVDSPSLHKVSANAQVVATGESKTDGEGMAWFFIHTRGGIKGYIRSDFLDPT